jgi:rod shape-determining protein MreB
MFDHLLSPLLPFFYVKISAECVTVRNVKAGIEVSEVPEIAIADDSGKKIILAVGKDAREIAAAQASTLVNPFSHPRTLLADFTIGEQVLKALIRRVQGNRWLHLAPRIVIHPLGSPGGGFTQIERRAFLELAKCLGASRAALWIGRELSDREVRSDRVLRSALK